MNQQALDRLYIDIAVRVSAESHSIRNKVGAVLVLRDGTVSYGWNGTPCGFDNCCERRNYRHELETLPEVIHAETNAIAKLAKTGSSSTTGSTMYLTLSPCYPCALLLIQCGITRLVYVKKYRHPEPLELLLRAGVEVVQYEQKS